MTRHISKHKAPMPSNNTSVEHRYHMDSVNLNNMSHGAQLSDTSQLLQEIYNVCHSQIQNQFARIVILRAAPPSQPAGPPSSTSERAGPFAIALALLAIGLLALALLAIAITALRHAAALLAQGHLCGALALLALLAQGHLCGALALLALPLLAFLALQPRRVACGVQQHVAIGAAHIDLVRRPFWECRARHFGALRRQRHDDLTIVGKWPCGPHLRFSHLALPAQLGQPIGLRPVDHHRPSWRRGTELDDGRSSSLLSLS